MARNRHPAIEEIKTLAANFARRNHAQSGQRKNISGWDYDVFMVQLSRLNRAWEEGWCDPIPENGELMMSEEEQRAEAIRGC